MILNGAGGLGRGGKFSKAKGKEEVLQATCNRALQTSVQPTSLIIMSFGATSPGLTSKTAQKHQLQAPATVSLGEAHCLHTGARLIFVSPV